jgi:hypothetical protein
VAATGSAKAPDCDCELVEDDRTGKGSAVAGWALAGAAGAMMEAESSFFAVVFGFAPSSAHSAGAITKATAIVAINRAADLILAPSVTPTTATRGRRPPLRIHQAGLCFLLKSLPSMGRVR